MHYGVIVVILLALVAGYATAKKPKTDRPDASLAEHVAKGTLSADGVWSQSAESLAAAQPNARTYTPEEEAKRTAEFFRHDSTHESKYPCPNCGSRVIAARYEKADEISDVSGYITFCQKCLFAKSQRRSKTVAAAQAQTEENYRIAAKP